MVKSFHYYYYALREARYSRKALRALKRRLWILADFFGCFIFNYRVYELIRQRRITPTNVFIHLTEVLAHFETNMNYFIYNRMHNFLYV